MLALLNILHITSHQFGEPPKSLPPSRTGTPQLTLPLRVLNSNTATSSSLSCLLPTSILPYRFPLRFPKSLFILQLRLIKALQAHKRRMISRSDKRKSHFDLEDLEGVDPSQSVPSRGTQAQRQKTPLWQRSVPKDDAAKLFKRKRTVSPGREKVNGRAVASGLLLPKAVRAGVRAHEYVEIKHESPWKSFQKVYELKFDNYNTVAIRKALPCEVVTVKGFTESEVDEKLDMLQRIRHENFVAFLGSFQFEQGSYAVLEHVPVSLAQIVASPPYPTELQLAAMLGQVRPRRDVQDLY